MSDTKQLVTVTLTLEEWFAFMARTVNRQLSVEGTKTYRRAADKLAEQIKAAAL